MTTLMVVLGSACGGASPSMDAGVDDHHEDAGAGVTHLMFGARAGSQAFACGTAMMLGSPATAFQPMDLRFYVTDVKLKSHDGDWVPFVLTPDSKFQDADSALLDFEDGTGGCVDGTSATHTTLTGSAPAGHYHGVSFTVGLPFAKNHGDAAAAAPPLDSTAMFWNWQFGYRFLKIEGSTSGMPAGWLLHLGSTGCMPGSAPNSVSSCTNPNMVTVELEGDFDPETSVISLDLATLFSGNDLDVNLNDAPGCMSGDTDTDCPPIFTRLGLPTGVQSVFSLANP